MQNKIDLYALVPRRQDAEIEATILSEVLPLVETGSTRGGQIRAQALLKHEDHRYLWLVGYETTGGSWHQEHLAEARAKLESLAVIYATRSLRLLSSAVRETHGDEEFHKQFPVGLPGAIVRINPIGPRFDSSSDAFERTMIEEILPAVRLHHGNRLGHTVDSQLLLKEERISSSAAAGDRYQWWISRTVHETFKEREMDSFRNDMKEALDKLEQVGDLHESSDYRILPIEK
jgi:hypothetical protein